MCGIAGIFLVNTAMSGDALGGIAQAMGDAIASRGPDDHGVWVDASNGLALAHRRLSIIDLSTGQQPLYNEDGSVVVVFNGEIYNYLDLVP